MNKKNNNNKHVKAWYIEDLINFITTMMEMQIDESLDQNPLPDLEVDIIVKIKLLVELGNEPQNLHIHEADP